MSNFCFAVAKVLLFFELPSFFATFFIKNFKFLLFPLVFRQKDCIFAATLHIL